MCWFMEAVPPSAFIIFVSLIRSIRCDSFSNAIEGESAKLKFTYPCNSTKITLQYKNRLPFYSSTNPDFLDLNPDQSERFTVEDKTEGDHCYLQLSMEPVKRLDGGVYILLAYIGDYITRIGLHVDFFPGEAHCSFGGIHDYTGDWDRLLCEATVGSMLGQIQCYQGGMVMPFLSAPSENDNTLEQTILVRKNRHHVYCCSSQLIEPKERCDCNDAVWDPLSQGEVHNPGDPCPTTTHVPNASPTTTTHAPTAPLTTSYHPDHTSSYLTDITPHECGIKEDIYSIIKHLIGLFIVVFFMLMAVFIAYVLYLAGSQSLRRRGNEKEAVMKPLLL